MIEAPTLPKIESPADILLKATILGRGITGLALLEGLVNDHNLEDGPYQITTIDEDLLEDIGGLASKASKKYPFLTLNVPAGSMSFYKNDPDHFARFLNDRYPGQYDKSSYVPRHIFYNEYALEILKGITAKAKERNIQIQHITGYAETITADQDTAKDSQHLKHIIKVKQKDGKNAIVEGDIAFLAAGNTSPKEIPINDVVKEFTHPNIIQTPLREIERIEEFFADLVKRGKKTAEIVLNGFGNTGIDIALIANHLAKENGIKLTINAIQRHNDGIVVHTAKPVNRAEELKALLKGHHTVASFWGVVRRLLKQTSLPADEIIKSHDHRTRIDELLSDSESPLRPQDVIDAARTYMNDNWSLFPDAEKKKFLKETGPYAEYRGLRNRVTPETAARLKELLAEGTLKLHTGKLTYIESEGEDQPLGVFALTKNEKGRMSNNNVIGKDNNLLLLNTRNPDQSLEASPILYQIREMLVKARAHLGGYLFRENTNPLREGENANSRPIYSNLVKTEDPRLNLVPTDHDISLKIENSGWREKRDRVKEVLAEVKDFIIPNVRTRKFEDHKSAVKKRSAGRSAASLLQHGKAETVGGFSALRSTELGWGGRNGEGATQEALR